MSYHYYVETVAHLLKPGKLSYLIMNLLYIYKSAYGIYIYGCKCIESIISACISLMGLISSM